METHYANLLGETICGNNGILAGAGETPSCLFCLSQTVGVRPSVPTRIYPPGEHCADCGQTNMHWPGCDKLKAAKRKEPKTTARYLAGTATALIVLSFGFYGLVGCSGSGGASTPKAADPNRIDPPGTLIKDIDRNYTTTFCDHGNRVYRGNDTVAVVPNDPSCAEAPR